MLIAIALAAAVASDDTEYFKRMHALEGNWKGTVQWTGVITSRGEMGARRYRLTGRGSALIEDLLDGEQPVMTSVYHLDNGVLRLTHYCGAQNQPRLKAAAIDLQRNQARFDFVDITNLARPDAPHVHSPQSAVRSPQSAVRERASTRAIRMRRGDRTEQGTSRKGQPDVGRGPPNPMPLTWRSHRLRGAGWTHMFVAIRTPEPASERHAHGKGAKVAR